MEAYKVRAAGGQAERIASAARPATNTRPKIQSCTYRSGPWIPPHGTINGSVCGGPWSAPSPPTAGRTRAGHNCSWVGLSLPAESWHSASLPCEVKQTCALLTWLYRRRRGCWRRRHHAQACCYLGHQRHQRTCWWCCVCGCVRVDVR